MKSGLIVKRVKWSIGNECKSTGASYQTKEHDDTAYAALHPSLLSDGLDVTESSLAGAGGDQGQGLVHAAEGGHVDGLEENEMGGRVEECGGGR